MGLQITIHGFHYSGYSPSGRSHISRVVDRTRNFYLPPGIIVIWKGQGISQAWKIRICTIAGKTWYPEALWPR